MTQTYLTSAVLTVSTGVLFAGPGPAFELMHDLNGAPVGPEEVAEAQAEMRAEIVRQHPWIADLRIPDDPMNRHALLARVRAEHGSTLDLLVDTRISA